MFSILVCVLGIWCVFPDFGACLKILVCVLANWCVFWEIGLCFVCLTLVGGRKNSNNKLDKINKFAENTRSNAKM